MAAKAAEQVLVALTSFVGLDGAVVVQGSTYTADHPNVRKWPALFGPIEARHGGPKVEQATAAPGEKRG